MEEIKREKYLPIGSVVILKEAEKKIMVTGFLPVDTEDEDNPVAYDYSGCLYPEGILSFEEVLLFDHDQIDKIFFLGYEDEEEKKFKENFEDEIESLIEEFEDEDEEIEKTSENEKENIFENLRDE